MPSAAPGKTAAADSMPNGKRQRGGTLLFDTIKTASKMTKRVLVGVSGGKDSTVVLDLCVKYFEEVIGYSMWYPCKGLSGIDYVIRHYERRYGIKIFRVPHFEVSSYMHYGAFRQADPSVPILSDGDVLNMLRDQTGIYWIASGERISDSFVRGAMIKHSGTIDDKRGRIYAVAYWKPSEILYYIKTHKLKLSDEFKYLGHSLGGLTAKNMLVTAILNP
jgi:phosphoadenosine phosphosulfate reductase